MKTTINGFEVEGTPDEIRELINIGTKVEKVLEKIAETPKIKRTYKKRKRKHHRYTREEMNLISGYMDNGLSPGEIKSRMKGLTYSQVNGAINRIREQRKNATTNVVQ